MLKVDDTLHDVYQYFSDADMNGFINSK